jgi:hypothetical protein
MSLFLWLEATMTNFSVVDETPYVAAKSGLFK